MRSIRCFKHVRHRQVEFTVIPDDVMAILRSGHLVRNFYMLYGMLDHCSIYIAQALARTCS